jgi:hypothetical protein
MTSLGRTAEVVRGALLSLPLFLATCGGRTPLLPPTCNLVALQTAVDFGEVSPGTTVLRNPGFDSVGVVACTISRVRLLADSDAGFAIPAWAPRAGLIPPQSEVGMAVTFTPPDGWPPIERKGALAFETDDPMRPHVEVALTAHIQSRCKLAVSPTSVDFGHVALDSSAGASVQVENRGDGPCAVNGVGLAVPADAQFALAPAQATSIMLAPGDAHAIDLVFHATDVKTPHHRTAVLTFQSTDPAQPVADVPLSADIDIGCELLVSPAQIDFGNVVLNNQATAEVNLRNDGSAVCQVSGVALSAATDATFSLEAEQPTAFPVAPGATVSIPVTFDASDSAPPHLKTGTLVFQTGNPRAPDGAVPLSGTVKTPCVSASQWIYTVDMTNLLARFDPSTLSFTKIAVLDCRGPAGPSASPNSMAVDQNGVAWVAYWDGHLYKVDTTTGKCEPTSFGVGQHGLYQFGMGFVFDPTTDADTLYIAGGNSVSQAASTLATVSFPDLVVTPVGRIDIGLPELTGTGDGQMWGFLAPGGSVSGQSVLARFDPATGKTRESYTYPTLTVNSSWAMKFWGGDFWVFLNDLVYKVPRDTPDSIKQMTTYPYGYVVGAGVSSCAPVQKK